MNREDNIIQNAENNIFKELQHTDKLNFDMNDKKLIEQYIRRLGDVEVDFHMDDKDRTNTIKQFNTKQNLKSSVFEELSNIESLSDASVDFHNNDMELVKKYILNNPDKQFDIKTENDEDSYFYKELRNAEIQQYDILMKLNNSKNMSKEECKVLVSKCIQEYRVPIALLATLSAEKDRKVIIFLDSSIERFVEMDNIQYRELLERIKNKLV